MRKEAIVIVALLVLIGQGNAGSEPYTIKLKPYPSKEKTFTVKTTDRLETTATVRDEAGKVVSKQSESVTVTEEYTQTTLTTAEGKLASFQREYAVSKGSDGKEKRSSAYEGKTITFVLKEKGCAIDLKDVKLTPEEARKLLEAHTDGLALLHRLMPDKAIKEGDEWPLSGKQIVSGLKALPIDPDKSKGKGKLLSVAKIDGRPVGKMELEFDLVTIEGAEGSGGGKFVVLVETALDGSSTKAKLTIKGSLALDSMNKQGKIRAEATGELTVEISEEK